MSRTSSIVHLPIRTPVLIRPCLAPSHHTDLFRPRRGTVTTRARRAQPACLPACVSEILSVQAWDDSGALPIASNLLLLWLLLSLLPLLLR